MESFFEYMDRRGFEKGKREGRLEGKREGEREGERKGESRLAQLINYLLKAGKYNEATLATEDSDKRQALYRQYGIA